MASRKKYWWWCNFKITFLLVSGMNQNKKRDDNLNGSQAFGLGITPSISVLTDMKTTSIAETNIINVTTTFITKKLSLRSGGNRQKKRDEPW